MSEDTNVVELNSESLYYRDYGEDVTGFEAVGDSTGGVEFKNNHDKGTVSIIVSGHGELSSEKLKSLCVAWLALEHPDVLKFDDA